MDDVQKVAKKNKNTDAIVYWSTNYNKMDRNHKEKEKSVTTWNHNQEAE